MIGFSIFYSFFTLFSRRNRGIARYFKGAILGIALSIVPLVVVMEVVNGMIEGITARYLELGSYHMQVFLDDNVSLQELKDLVSYVRKISGVTIAIAEKRGFGLLYYKGRRDTLTIRAVEPDIYAMDSGFKRYFRIVEGNFNLRDNYSIIISKSVADKLHVGCGDKLLLLTLSANSNSSHAKVPIMRAFRVEAIFTTGYDELDKMIAYIPIQTGFRILDGDSSYTIIGVKSTNPFKGLGALKDSIAKNLSVPSYIYTWYELEVSQYKSFQTTKALLLFVMVLLVVVATFGISSSITMTIIEKQREIAILKCVGASPGGIVFSFGFIGFLSGLVGTLIGIIVSLFLSLNINEIFYLFQQFVNGIIGISNWIIDFIGVKVSISPFEIFNKSYYLDRIPISINFLDILSVAVIALIFSTLAAVLPARKAGDVKPVELLNRV